MKQISYSVFLMFQTVKLHLLNKAIRWLDKEYTEHESEIQADVARYASGSPCYRWKHDHTHKRMAVVSLWQQVWYISRLVCQSIYMLVGWYTSISQSVCW